MKGLGARQRRILIGMRERGQGFWPADWMLRHPDRQVLSGLFARGLVTNDTKHARLTIEGQRVSAWLTGERPHSRAWERELFDTDIPERIEARG